jgi:hypothetical protein
VKFGTALVFGVSATGYAGGGRGEGGGKRFGKEIPEKITKTVSGRTESSCFLELPWDIHGKGIPPRTTETKVLDCSVARVA